MAEERVKIAEIDIGVDKLVSKAAETKKRIAEIQASQKALKKETDNLTNATQDQLEQYTRHDIEAKKLSKEYRNSTKVLDAYINIQNQDIRTKQQARDANSKLIAIANELDTTNEDHAALLEKVNAEIDQNTDFIKENASEYENTKIGIGNYKEGVQAALNETGLFSAETQKLQSVFKAFSPVFGTVKQEFQEGSALIRGNTTATEGLTKAQKAQTGATTAGAGALKIFRAALIATGIGAFVVILGSLVSYLASTQEGIDKVNRVLTPMKEIFQALWGLVQDFGKDMFEAFSNPKQLIKDVGEIIKQNLINRFEAVIDIFNRIVNFDFDGIGDDIIKAGTGVENASEKVRDFGKQTSEFFGDAVKRGQEIQKLQEDIEKREINQGLIRQKNTNILREQELIAKDRSKTDEERQAALEKAQEAAQNIVDYERETLDMKIRQLELQQKANDTSREEEKELANLRAERLRLEEEQQRTEMRFLGTKNQLENEAESEKKAAQQAALQHQEELFQAELKRNQLAIKKFELEQGYAQKSASEQLAVAEEVYQKQLEIEKKKLEAGKISQEELNLFILENQNELAKMQAEIAIANAEKELEAFKENHQSRIDANEFLSEQLFQQEQDRLNRILEEEKIFHQKRLEQGLINQEEYNEAINQINEENRKEQAALRAERDQAERDREAIDFANRRALAQENFLAEMDLERERLEQKRQLELENAEKTGADKDLIHEKYAQQERERQEAIKDFKINTAADTFSNMANILGKESAAGKAAAVAATTIDTYQSATAAYKAMAGIPVVGPALGAVAAAAAVASGLQTVKQITSVKKPDIPRAEQGATFDIKGRSHAQGGETFYDEYGNPIVEAQGGEKMVILKREASKELNALSQLNQKHGGVSLSKPVTYANNGGAVVRPSMPSIPRATSQPFDYDRLGNVLADRVNGVQTVLPVDSFNARNNRSSKIVNGASE